MYNSVLCYLEKTLVSHSDKIAVVDKNSSITFGELDRKARILAANIALKGMPQKSPILVYLPKSCSSIVAFIGILYSGNFYTPTDVKFPFEKTRGIINVLEPVLYITESKYKEKLLSNGVDEQVIIDVNSLEENILQITSNIIDTDVVYTMFTSGSTGVPKGVAISNRSIIDYIDWAQETFQINASDRIGNQAPFYFDNSTLDLYLCMSTGATLYIIDEKLFAFPMELMSYICEKKINFVFWVPSVLISVANTDILSRMDCTCLDKILFAGEVMPNKQLNYWRKHIPNAVYANLYGPTEITVDCTYYIVDRKFEDDETLPIGRPCRNSDVMILAEDYTEITEVNKIGELCVRGSSLALGYWNNLEKTEEVFIQNPLQKHYPEKIYKTGDLVYYNENGEIVFVGRKDFQIKHMGYRIELGEIETVAMANENINNCCVIYDQIGRHLILCYEARETIPSEMISAYFKTMLPKYMIPTRYIFMEELPINDNGKIDRKKLQLDVVGGITHG